MHRGRIRAIGIEYEQVVALSRLARQRQAAVAQDDARSSIRANIGSTRKSRKADAKIARVYIGTTMTSR